MSRIGSQVLCRIAQGGVGVVGRWRGKRGKMGKIAGGRDFLIYVVVK